MRKDKKKEDKFLRKYMLSLGIPMVMISSLLLANQMGMLKNIEQLANYYITDAVFPSHQIVGEVIDGDTFVATNGARIRLLGMNAPDRGSDEYVESKTKLAEMILNKEVWIEYDGYKSDKYGRSLAWVWVGCEGSPRFLPPDYMRESKIDNPDLTDNPENCSSGKLINEEMVIHGKGVVTFYKDRGRLKYQKRMERVVVE